MTRFTIAIALLLVLMSCYYEDVQEPPPNYGGGSGGQLPPPPDPQPQPQPPPMEQLRVVGPIGYAMAVDGASPAAGTVAAYAFTGRAGSTIELLASQPQGGSPVRLYGPVPPSGVLTEAPLLVAAAGPFPLQQDGTYLVGIAGSAAGGAPFTVEVRCGSGECRPQCAPASTCPAGSACALVQCIRAPCPSFCQPQVGAQPSPPPSTGTGAVGATCGTRGAVRCAAGLYCHHPLSARCGVADAPGQCERIPDICTREFAPVCGCDRQTYSNSCGAAAAGVSVLRTGGC